MDTPTRQSPLRQVHRPWMGRQLLNMQDLGNLGITTKAQITLERKDSRK